jgi:hypothetical protein
MSAHFTWRTHKNAQIQTAYFYRYTKIMSKFFRRSKKSKDALAEEQFKPELSNQNDYSEPPPQHQQQQQQHPSVEQSHSRQASNVNGELTAHHDIHVSTHALHTEKRRNMDGTTGMGLSRKPRSVNSIF